jgi:hypothetical protein
MFRRFLAVYLVLAVLGSGRAQEESRDSNTNVEIARVQSGTIRANGGDTWYQVEVTVRVKGAGSGRSRYASGVGINLSLATEVKEAEGGLEFYRAAVTAVALESGQHTVRFFIPPEVVSRDRLQTALRYWVIDLTAAERELPINRSQVGDGFSSPAALENFRQRLAVRSKQNEGVLLPQHLTPFRDTAGVDTTPTMTRAEAVQPHR